MTTRTFRLVWIIPMLAVLLGLSSFSFLWSLDGGASASSSDPGLIHPKDTLRPVLSSLNTENTPAAEELAQLAKATLERSPLESGPFTLAAFARSRQGQYDDAYKLAAVARKRAPRSLQSLILSVDVNLAHGDVAGVVENLEVLMRRAPQQGAQWREILAILATNPETAGTVFKTLKGDRNKMSVLVAQANSGADAAIVLQAIKRMKGDAIFSQDPAAIARVTNPFIRRKAYGDANQIWAKLTKEGQSLIRDPSFDKEVPPPFGWDLRSSSQGFAVRQSPGLTGKSYGRRKTMLARQLLVLSPGSYEIRVSIAQASDLVDVVVKCTANPELVRLNAARVGALSEVFDVPSDCEAQWIEVQGKASVNALAQDFAIKSIDVVRVRP